MKMHDERVLQLNNKIQSEAYRLALFLSGGSVFIKTYVLHMSFGQYAVELGILILTTIYIVVRSMLLGSDFVNSSKKGKVMAMVGGFMLCLAASVVSGIRNYTPVSYTHLAVPCCSFHGFPFTGKTCYRNHNDNCQQNCSQQNDLFFGCLK